ncbi:hypothetical protein XU18_4214 [Perkinsela sp. CCAP 1560/4]|nr:hypothetical protein XU18_4214 [Perkinsela sp. CCAP 1560/4]|eukprot:KNH04572.1 hypothetical protein XU18_4214 [Perkinsela sp. CCAP 1560/4]
MKSDASLIYHLDGCSYPICSLSNRIRNESLPAFAVRDYIFSTLLCKLKYDMMPQQALMELHVSKMPENGEFQDEMGNFLNATDWSGVGYSKNQGVVMIT